MYAGAVAVPLIIGAAVKAPREQIACLITSDLLACGIAYLRAIEGAGTDEAKAVMAKMREIPVNDFYAKNGRVREDGRMVHDMYFVQVKTPEESSGPWDYYKILSTIPGDQAFRPLDEGGCPLVKQR